MVARGHDVEVLTQASRRATTQSDDVDGIVVRRFPLLVRSPDYAVAPGLGRFLRANAHRYDVVHAHNYHALVATMAASARPRAFVFTPHYHGTSASAVRRALHIPYRRVGSYIIRQAQRVICVSHREAALVRRD